ncbi:MAG: carbamoyltransferase [Nitrospinae bacterium]|nr:carbamoyltransferase [Nitrospinota bacterium]
MNILGISAYYHDSAAALIQDGKLIAAAQEERFTRIKHDHSFPINACNFCLETAGIEVSDIDYLVFYDKPFIKFERILSTYIATFPYSFPSFVKAIPLWLHEKLWLPQDMKKKLGYEGEVLFTEHHQSHAGSSYLVSPWDEAAILTTDGVGEFATTTLAVGKGNKIEILDEIHFPHSLGLLYTAFTYYLGFKVNSAEYKVMGLAPYGKPEYYDLIMNELIHVKDDGSFKMNMKYFGYDYGLRMTNSNFDKLFGGPPRKSEEGKLTQREYDLAMSVQKVTEEIVLKLCNTLQKKTGLKQLCLAGGVALNCVSNGRLLRESDFDDVFVQPASGDAGGAVGAAYFVYNSLLDNPKEYTLPHSYFGPEFSNDEIGKFLDKDEFNDDIKYEKLDDDALVKKVAQLIDEQGVIGWFQGRMEFGPRALGNRSIIADPRNPENRDIVNIKIKFRESFRPFAPSVLRENCSDYFELDYDSPYMLLVAQVKENNRTIPAVTHVDGSARIQTVTEEQNPLYYKLIKAFNDLTGCPVIINTSFNVRSEPIVCTPKDAYLCFMRTNMDHLVLGNYLLSKKDFKEELLKNYLEDKSWMEQHELD